jgi:hypothetical protein
MRADARNRAAITGAIAGGTRTEPASCPAALVGTSCDMGPRSGSEIGQAGTVQAAILLSAVEARSTLDFDKSLNFYVWGDL